MKNFFLFLFLFISIQSVYSQSGNRRVLFIGNSYTYSNNLPQMLYDAAKSTGDTVIFDSSTPGGYTFQNHTTNSTTLTKIAAGNWDYVVLQEQSQLPSFTDGEVASMVFPYARYLDSLINLQNPCAETVFFMTWGRKNGDATNCGVWPPVCTYEGMDSLLNLRYRMMADMNDALVSPVGAVWHYIRDNHPAIELYSADESHPSLAGSYAAACSFYTVMFRKNPSYILFDGGLPAADALTIRDAARRVVYDSLLYWHVGEYDPLAAFSYAVVTGNEIQFTNQSLYAGDFLWDFGDGTTSTEVSPAHVYAVNGSYTVLLTAAHCDYSVTVEQTVDVITSVDQAGSAHITVLKPNPLTGLSVLSLPPHAENEEIQVYICDIAGRVVRILTSDPAAGNDIVIEKGNLNPGTYIIQVNGSVTTRIRMVVE